jgi:polysaccharide deacetylase 2 family uncharacterized protein YibQ
MLKRLALARLTSGIATLLTILAAAVIAQPTAAEGKLSEPVRVVLIIDDMGNNLDLGLQALALPGAINYAFLPHSPHSHQLATAAHQQAKEVLLHAPMSNLRSHPTGPGTLKPIMNRQQFLQTLQDDLASVPHVRGLNNHMGSLLTQLRQPMNWLMDALKQQQLYFVDSRTSPRTIAATVAKKHQLPALKRDVFLDNKRTEAAIDFQFKRLTRLAKSRGIAVAIGHPYPETLDYLKRELPSLAAQGIQLTLASSALDLPDCSNPVSPCKPLLTLAELGTDNGN